MKFPRVMLSKNGNILDLAKNESEWIFLRSWGFNDIGAL